MAEARIDQLLFGYSDGHELLASSVSVEPRIEGLLLPHTDASFEDDAEHYLAGVPLESLASYLLVRIWPAPEVTRPGAVWAHGLLLNAQLMRAERLTWLLGLFRRPEGDFAVYHQPVPVGTETRSEGFPVPDALGTALTWAALGAPDRGPVVLWSPVQEAETALLRLLEAVPVAARWRLSFRTRGRARLGATRYDVQVASTLAGRTATLETPVLDARIALSQEPPSWTVLLSGGREASALRRFLHQYGEEEAADRGQVAGLARVWASLDAREPPGATVQALLEVFPKPSSVVDLRADLLGAPSEARNLWPLAEDCRLQLLIENTEGFDPKRLGVVARLRELWRGEHRERALELTALGMNVDPSLEAELIRIAAEEIVAVELARLVRSRPLLGGVLTRRPELLEDGGLWAALPNPLAEELLRDHGAKAASAGLARAVLQGGNIELVGAAIDAVVVEIEDVMDVLLSEDPSLGQVREVAEVRPQAFRNWLTRTRLPPERGLTLARALPVRTLQARAPKAWVPTAKALHSSGDSSSLPAATRLLILGVWAVGASGDQLLRECFAPVHRALVEGRLDRESWAELRLILPTHKSSIPEDRLRRLLVQRAEGAGWRESDLLRAVDGAGEDGARLSDLLPKKHPLRRAVERAVDSVADLVR